MYYLKLKFFRFFLIWLNFQLVLSLNQQCRNMIQKIKDSSNLNEKKLYLQQIYAAECPTKIIPRYRWSQNMSHIQVKVQFRTSSQTTTCDQVLFQRKIVEHNKFQIQVLCIYSKKYLISYFLNIITFKSLDYTTAVWKKNEQNSIILECLKSPSPYFWPILHSRTVVPGRTPKIWWQMMSLYGSQLKKVIDLLQIGDQDKEISKKIKNKKRKKFNDDLNVQFNCFKGSPQHLGSWL